MQGGDLEAWITPTVVVVLEDTLATVVETDTRKWGFRRVPKVVSDPDQWQWHDMPLRSIADLTSRLGVKVEVVTFLGEEVADKAADWFDRYGIYVAGVEGVNFEQFCRSLIRRPEVDRVVDSQLDRLMHYGQKGYAVSEGAVF